MNISSMDAGAQGQAHWRRRAIISLIAALTVMAIILAPGGSASAAGTIERVSTDAGGGEANNESFYPAVSADGRYIAFESNATNLVSGDTNGVTDIFLKDTLTGVITRMSTDSAGAESNSASRAVSISGNGRYVGFATMADNLVPGDTNGWYDVFVKDAQTGVTTRVSTDSNGGQLEPLSMESSISDDGRFVAFSTSAHNITTNGYMNVFLKDTLTGSTTLVSASNTGVEGTGDSQNPNISADGRYVAFDSLAANLVPSDSNGYYDVFIKDTQTGNITRISTSNSGAEGDAWSYNAAISGDGRYVAFQSMSGNLVAGDANSFFDIFLKDSQTGAITRISTSADGTGGNHDSYSPTVSGDGRYVSFASVASNLVPGSSSSENVFIKDALTGSITLLSQNSSGEAGNNCSEYPSITADGSLVAFNSSADNLVTGDTNGGRDIFVASYNPPPAGPTVSNVLPAGSTFEDTATISADFADNSGSGIDTYSVTLLLDGAPLNGCTITQNHVSCQVNGLSKGAHVIGGSVSDNNGGNSPISGNFTVDCRGTGLVRISVDSSGGQSNGASGPASNVSADGRYSVFPSDATNLVPSDGNGFKDVFVRDNQTGAVTKASVGQAGNAANGGSVAGQISGDGRYLAFPSSASNLVSGDTNARQDIFLKDLATGAISRESTGPAGEEANGASNRVSLSSDGRYILFYSDASNLVSSDTNSAGDIFLKDTSTGATSRISTDSSGTQSNGASFGSKLSAGGRFIAFSSAASNLVTGDANSAWDIFIKDMHTGQTNLASTSAAGDQGNSNSGLNSTPGISADGRYVVFQSAAANLVTGDNNNTDDIFFKDMQAGTIIRVSTGAAGDEANASSQFPSISNDGRYVAFSSSATNLTADDVNGVDDIFVKDLGTGDINRLSRKTLCDEANAKSQNPAISENGRYITFSSVASNLTANDTNGVADIFLAPNSLWRPSDTMAPATTNNAPSEWQNADFTVNLVCSDAGSGCASTSYTIDDVPGTGISININTEGDHTIVYHSVDNAGNIENDQTVHAMLDKTAPGIKALSPQGRVCQVPAAIEADLADSGSGISEGSISVSVDGGQPLAGCTINGQHLSCPVSGLSGGSHSYTVGVEDRAGNATTSAAAFQIDQPPLLSAAANSVTVYEGSTAKNSGQISDPDGDPLSISASAGTVAAQPDGSFNWSLATKDGPAESQTVTLTVSDGCQSIQQSFQLSVQNMSPTVAAINGLPSDPARTGTSISASANFADPGVLDTHTATWDWGDGQTSSGSVSEQNGSGTVSASHTYNSAGLYTIDVRVTDNDNASSHSSYSYLVVYNPDAGSLNGAGWIYTAGAITNNPSVSGWSNFSVNARYNNSDSVPTGVLQFSFPAARLNFTSRSFDWLIVSNGKAILQGRGSVNGNSGYGFMISAIDGKTSGNGPDRCRIKIWQQSDGSEILDTQKGDSYTADPKTALALGSVSIR